MNWNALSLSAKRFLLYSTITLLIFLLIFTKFASELVEKELHTFDYTIIQYIQSFISPRLTIVMEFFTFMGSGLTILVFLFIILIFMLWKKRRWEALFLSLATTGGIGFNLLLKWIFHRHRPTIHPIIQETGYSFPSGHSMGSFVFYGMIGYFLFLFLKRRTSRVISLFVIILFIFMIGISRIYLGVHYPSDVLAGFAAGGVWLIICIMGLFVEMDLKKKNDGSSDSSR